MLFVIVDSERCSERCFERLVEADTKPDFVAIFHGYQAAVAGLPEVRAQNQLYHQMRHYNDVPGPVWKEAVDKKYQAIAEFSGEGEGPPWIRWGIKQGYFKAVSVEVVEL